MRETDLTELMAAQREYRESVKELQMLVRMSSRGSSNISADDLQEAQDRAIENLSYALQVLLDALEDAGEVEVPARGPDDEDETVELPNKPDFDEIRNRAEARRNERAGGAGGPPTGAGAGGPAAQPATEEEPNEN